MIEFYPQIRHVHIASAIASGALFALRGAAVLAGARWPLSAPVRWLSYAIDTVLLTAALMLLRILPWSMFGNGWLLAKVTLIAGYILLATLALRGNRTTTTRAGFYLAALLTFGFVVAIARAHHPLGLLHALAG